MLIWLISIVFNTNNIVFCVSALVRSIWFVCLSVYLFRFVCNLPEPLQPLPSTQTIPHPVTITGTKAIISSNFLVGILLVSCYLILKLFIHFKVWRQVNERFHSSSSFFSFLFSSNPPFFLFLLPHSSPFSVSLAEWSPGYTPQAASHCSETQDASFHFEHHHYHH